MAPKAANVPAAKPREPASAAFRLRSLKGHQRAIGEGHICETGYVAGYKLAPTERKASSGAAPRGVFSFNV